MSEIDHYGSAPRLRLPRAASSRNRRLLGRWGRLRDSPLPLEQLGASLSSGSRCFLDLHCISRVTRHVGCQLLRMCWAGWPASATQLNQPTIADLQLCLSAVNETVARGYAQGIRLAIGHHLPDLYRAGRNQPRLSEPWVLVRKEPGSPLTIEIVWARLTHNPD